MTDETNGQANLSLTVPLGALAAAAVLGLGAVAYILYARGDAGGEIEGAKPAKSRGGMRRKVGLMTLIAVIENDTGRRLLLTVLKAMARRA